MDATLDQILAGIGKLADEVPGVQPEYMQQLKEYLLVLAHGARKKTYERWYAAATKKALVSALQGGKLDDFTKLQINTAFRMMDQYCSTITALPIVEEEVPGCVVTLDGRVIRPYLVLPNNERIPLYQP